LNFRRSSVLEKMVTWCSCKCGRGTKINFKARLLCKRM